MSLRRTIDEIMRQRVPGLSPGASLLLARNGEIKVHQAFGLADLERSIPAEPESRYLIASVSKQFTCAAALLLMEDGLLRLDDPLSRHLPGLPAWSHQVILRQLMTHVSGVPDYFTDEFIETWCGDDSPALDQDGLVNFIATSFPELEFQPDERFAYSNSAYVLLGAALERVAGCSLAELLHERVFAPLGMTRTEVGVNGELQPGMARGYLSKDGGFEPAAYNMTVVGWADGNIISTCGDLYRWHRAIMENRALRSETWKLVFTPQRLLDGSSACYGLGWFLFNRRGLTERWHSGGTVGYRCRVALFPEAENSSVILLTNADPKCPGDAYHHFGDLVQALIGDKLAPVPAWGPAPKDLAEAWLGDWTNIPAAEEPTTRLSIQADEAGRLTLRGALRGVQGEWRLTAMGERLRVESGADYYLDLEPSPRLDVNGRFILLRRPAEETA